MMKNNRYNLTIILISLIFIVIITLTNNKLIHEYNYSQGKVINNIIVLIKKKYPDVDVNEIIDVLNDKDLKEDNTLLKYGIDIDEKIASLNNEVILKRIIIINVIIIFSYVSFIIIYNIIVKNINKKRIERLIKYLNEINNKNYNLSIQSNDEGELSILQNEIYKVMVMLRESADNSLKDKINLKNSLSDISHQLKTPLTSINIALDNIINNPDMEDSIRTNFYYSIQREINNINTLVLDLLKLSKFDADVVSYNNKLTSIKEIIDLSLKKVELIADLKNIKFNISVDESLKFKCDRNWQVEALSNIIKNAIEYSNQDGMIDIVARDNNLYYKIEVKDYGAGIDEEDLPNIFNRFYKTKNSNKDSVGIGLSLAKAIIEKNDGIIKVKSTKGSGTTFMIKYYK